MAAAALDDDERGWAPPSRLTLLVGGEAYRPSLLPLARTARAVFNGYGVWLCVVTIRVGDDRHGQQGPSSSVIQQHLMNNNQK